MDPQKLRLRVDVVAESLDVLSKLAIDEMGAVASQRLWVWRLRQDTLLVVMAEQELAQRHRSPTALAVGGALPVVMIRGAATRDTGEVEPWLAEAVLEPEVFLVVVQAGGGLAEQIAHSPSAHCRSKTRRPQGPGTSTPESSRGRKESRNNPIRFSARVQ